MVDEKTGEISEALEVLPSRTDEKVMVYDGASMLQITEAEEKKLCTVVNPEEVEVKPDGLVYLPQVFYRDILNTTFGRGQWAIVQIAVTKIGEVLAFDGALHIRGKFVSRAMGEAHYIESNKNMSWATVYESAKSDCLTRCCKDLGIAKELWNPKYTRDFLDKYAVQVWRDKTGSSKNGIGSFQWRLRTSPAFYDERGVAKDTQPASSTSQKAQTESPTQEKKTNGGQVASTLTHSVDNKAPADKPTPAKTEELKSGNFIIPFGMHKGKRVDSLTDAQLKSTVAWCQKVGKFDNVVKKINEYLGDDGLNLPTAPQKAEDKRDSETELKSILSLVRGSMGTVALQFLAQRATESHNDKILNDKDFNMILEAIDEKQEQINYGGKGEAKSTSR